MGKSKKDSADLNNGLGSAIKEVIKAEDFSELKESLKNQSSIKNYLDKRGKSVAKNIFKSIIKSLEKAEKEINKCAGKKEENRSKIFENACLGCQDELELIKKKVKELKNEDTILANEKVRDKCKELIEKIKSMVNNFKENQNLHKKNTVALIKQLRLLSEALSNKEQEEVWEPFGNFFKSPVVKMFMKKKPSLSGRLLRECHKVYIRYRCTNKKDFIEKMGLFLEKWYNHNASFIPKNLKGTDKDSERRRESRTALGRDVLIEVKKVDDKLKEFISEIPEAHSTSAAVPTPADSAEGNSVSVVPAATPHQTATSSSKHRSRPPIPTTPPPPPPRSAPEASKVPPASTASPVPKASVDPPPPVSRTPAAPPVLPPRNPVAPATPEAPVAPPAPPPPTSAKPPVTAAPRSAAAKPDIPPAPVPRTPAAKPAPPAPKVPAAPSAPPPPTSAKPPVTAPQNNVTEQQGGGGVKDSLMKEIRRGKKLRSAKDRKLSTEPVVPEGGEGGSASNPNNLANALLNARLGNIRAVVADDDDSDSDSDNDEWGDI